MPNENPMTRDELLNFQDQLTVAEYKAFNKLRASLKHQEKDLNWYLAFGEEVMRICEPLNPAFKYGRMKQLARALDCSPSLLNKTRAFARQFNSVEVKALVRERIAWGMAYPTFSIKGKEKQIAWMRRARDEKWTVHVLEKQIQMHRKGPRRKGGRRRNVTKSYGYAVDLATLVRMSEEWLRYHREVWAARTTGLLDQLATLAPSDYSPELRDQLESAKAALEKMALSAAKLGGKFHTVRQKVQRVLDSSN